jgi:hypothetical protein
MADRWLGVVVSGDKVTFVDAEVDGDKPLILQSDQTWTLQSGNRSEAYATMSQQMADDVRENSIKRAVSGLSEKAAFAIFRRSSRQR